MMDLIEAYASWMRAGRYSPRTVEDRVGNLYRLHARLPYGLDNAAEDEIVAVLDEPRWHDNTVARYFQDMWGFYEFAVRRGKLALNPMEGMRRPRLRKGLPRPLSDEEANRILAEAEEPWRTLALVALGTGLRCIELAGLDSKKDVGERRVQVHYGKGSKARVVRPDPMVWPAVRHFPAGRLVTHLGGRADARWISVGACNYFRRKLDLPGVGMHRCRHWHATMLRRAGKDPYEIQAQMGHASLDMALRYVLITDEEGATSLSALPVFAAAA